MVQRRLRPGGLIVFVLATIVLAVLGQLAAWPRTAVADQPAFGTYQDESGDLFDDTMIRDLHFTFEDANWESRLDRLGEGEYVIADLVVDGVAYDDVGLRIKGNSSARGSGRKVPLNLTMDASVAGQDLMGYDTLNLNSGFMNPALVREIMTTGVLRSLMPMPQASYVRVFADDEYFGAYTLVEQIERTFLGQWFETNDGVLFKGDAPGGFAQVNQPDQNNRVNQVNQGPGGFRSNLSWLGENLSSYRSSYVLKTEEAGDAGYEKLRELTRVLDAPVSVGGVSDADFPDAIGDVLDVDGALWYIAGVNLFTNFDSYYAGHNFYFYWAEEDERFHILSWDVNESFGVFPGSGIDPSNTSAVSRTDPFLMVSGRDASSRPLVSRLLSVPRFRADYLAHYRTLLDMAFAPDMLEDQVDIYQDLVRESVRTDPNYIYSFNLFERNAREDVRAGESGRGGRAVPGILKVVDLRHAWLSARDDMQSPDHALYEHARDPEDPTTNDSVTIALDFSGSDVPTDVELVYRVEGSKPFVVAMHEDRGSWLGTIPKQGVRDDVTYYARATFDDGRTAFHPPDNQTQPWSYKVAGVALPAEQTGDLVINELVADNETGLVDEAGEFEDWLELYNRGQDPIDLAGYFLSDSADDPWAYALPDVVLGPGEYYLVWCDNDPEQGENHADFRLSKDGESVHLSTQDATVDSVAFEALATDAAYMRLPDGADDWVVCDASTPLEPNECEPSAVQTPDVTPTSATPASATPTEATPTDAPTDVPTDVPTSAPSATATDGPPPAAVYLPRASR